MNAFVRVLTYEAGRGGIGLDVLLSVALNHIPQSPHVARVKDVEGLVRVEFAVLDVRTEQVVVRTGVPLTKKERDNSADSGVLSGRMKSLWWCFKVAPCIASKTITL